MQTSQHQSQTSLTKQKTKEDYSRNVKKLKYKLNKISTQIQAYEKKLTKIQNTSSDQIIAMKLSKFCKQRSTLFVLANVIEFTPQMLFRFADVRCQNVVTRMEFRDTLTMIGLKLSSQELTRLEYLLDEDIKGDISLLQYSKYLHSFGLKTEYSPDDPFVKQTLKNIDFNKLLQVAKQDQTKKKKNPKDRILLTYEEFLKYCHKHFPQMKDKQLAKIFKQLQRDERIDLDDLVEYLENLRKEQERIDNKNKNNNKENNNGKKNDENNKKKGLLISEEQQETIQIDTLKGKLMAILKQHSQSHQTFHSSQFKRVQSHYHLQKGTMLKLFRQMDTKMTGSITFNDIIVYYVEQQTYKPNNNLAVKYSFILMGRKILAIGEKVQAVVGAFLKDETFVTLEEFVKLCQIQFGLRQQMAKKLYDVMLSCPGQKIKQNCVNTTLLISLMKVNLQSINNNIRPILEEQYKKYFFKKHYQTICTNGIVAYKICESIVNQLQGMQKYQKWHDFEFGPSIQDQTGIDSIGRNIASDNVRWHRASNLGMKQFYLPTNSKDQTIYSLSPLCANDLFYKSLQTLVKYYPSCLYHKPNQIVKHNKKVQQSQLLKLFTGIHPLAFHRFQDRGIYVMQFFINNKWIYVIVDDKIPCNQDDEPLFVRGSDSGDNYNNSCSFVQLIQKAYAKLKGSYEKMYQFPSLAKYIYELSSMLLHSKAIDNDQKNHQKIQRLLMTSTSIQAQKIQLQKIKQQQLTSTQYYFANLTHTEKKIKPIQQKSHLPVNSLVQIYFSSLIKDNNSSTTSHNLTLVTCPYPTNPQQKWNYKWHQKSSTFNRHQPIIKAEINKWDNKNQNTHNNKIYKNGRLQTIIMDFQTIRENFNYFTELTSYKFDDNTVLLRKQIQFERNFSCVYKVNSTDRERNVKLIVVLNKLRAPNDAKVLVTFKNATQQKGDQAISQQQQSHTTTKGQFSCLSFTIPSQQHDLQLKVDKFQPQQQYIYQLSFYFENPRYSLKQRDRHLLFRYVSQYEERSKLEFDFLNESEKKYFYQHFFVNAGRKGFLCC